jgi:hypothetical protein
MQANLLVSEWLMIGKSSRSEEKPENNININEEEVEQSAHASNHSEMEEHKFMPQKLRAKGGPSLSFPFSCYTLGRARQAGTEQKDNLLR